MRKMALIAMAAILVALLAGCAGGEEVDETTPVISSVSVSNITETGAAIAWNTNEPATSQVEYGATISYGSTTPLDSTLVTSHSVGLSGLNPDISYHYRVRSKDASANEAISGDYTFTTGPVAEKIEVHLTEWAVVDDFGTAALRLGFTTTSDVEFHLTNPDGVETDSAPVGEWEREAKLELAGYYEVPDSGQYILTVKDALGETITTETFEFIGADVTISEVSPTWEYGWDWGYYSLEDIQFKTSNDGDLPAYVSDCELSVDIVGESIYFGEVVLPGKKKIFSESVFLSEVTPGQKSMSLELTDDADRVVGSYSSTVTPMISDQTQFQLTDWTVVDYNGEAGLRLTFTTTGDVEITLANPDGVETDSVRINNGFGNTTLVMSGYYEVPDAGQYELTVKDAVDSVIARETFEFAGADVTISELLLTWRYYEDPIYYVLEHVSFTVANYGDLLCYISTGRLTVDSKEYIPVMMQAMLFPGEEQTFDWLPVLSQIMPGDREVTLELRDAAGKVVVSYSVVVMPSE
jgi:hypothetical protein